MIYSRLHLFSVLLVASLGLTQPRLAAQDSADRRNVVFFLVDDLGWADVGCFGSEFYETPNIDALCESGAKFTHGYAACPVCSPTRASILTGRHPIRVGITDWIPGASAKPNQNPRFSHMYDRDSLALEEQTIAEVLREAGYQTFFAGKWHLGDEGHWPEDQGFDFNIGGNSKGSPPGGYYAPWKNPRLQANYEGEYVTERLTEESMAFLENRDVEKPFLLYLSYYNVHTPITAYNKRHQHFVDKAETMFGKNAASRSNTGGQGNSIAEHDGYSRTRQDNTEYASMVSAVDDSVGALLDKLTELGIDDETAVFFFSDNGGLCTKAVPGPTSNLPLRSGKGWLYEGGVREPTIVRIPGVTEPGTTCETPMVSMDFFPTILHATGLPLQPELHADGMDLWPLLTNDTSYSAEREQIAERSLCWYYPHYHGSTWTPGASIRKGDWKLIEFYETDEVELYNVVADVGESNNLAASELKRTVEMQLELKDWLASMNAKPLIENRNYRRPSPE